MQVTTLISICGYISLSLLVTDVYCQSCSDSHGDYADEFPSGTSHRWLYENIAKGAECAAIARTQTDDDRWIEYMYNLPDTEWPQYDNSILPDNDDLILGKQNFSQYLQPGDPLPKSLCIQACRIRDWCKSVDWSYGYDKCRLSRSHGTPVAVNRLVTYIEKPIRMDNKIPNTTSVSYFRLALKMFAVMDYEKSLALMEMAKDADKFHKMNFWGVAMLTILNKKPVSEAKVVIDSLLTDREYPDVLTDTERTYFETLTTSLSNSDDLTLYAVKYKQIYNSQASSPDTLAGTIAAVLYKISGQMGDFKSLLVRILDKEPSTISALYLYLNEYTMDRETLLREDKTKILKYVSDLLAADGKNILAYKIALRVYEYYFMPQQILQYFGIVSTNSYVEEAKKYELITDKMAMDLQIEFYTLAHTSNLYRYDVSAAEEVEEVIDNMIVAATDPDTKARFTILSYMMKSSRYFELAFLELPSDIDQLAQQTDVGSVLLIDPVGDEDYTPARLSQYRYRQAILTRQLRAGDDRAYDLVVNNYRNLRDNLTRFDRAFTPVVNYNLHILSAEKALMTMDDETQEKLFGANGFLTLAAKLVSQIDQRSYMVVDVHEMIAYAVHRIAMDTPAPLGRSTDASIIPKDLIDLLKDIDNSWPNLTPSKLNSKARIQLDLEDFSGSLETLEVARGLMVQASIAWLERARESALLANTTDEIALGELGLPTFQTQEIIFDDEADKKINQSLDMGVTWEPDVSAMSPCNVFYYQNRADDNAALWTKIDQTTFISAESKSFYSTNVVSCKQRCIFETEFACKGFTFGFSRCILHSEAFSRALPLSKRFENVDDETYYGLPSSCPSEVTEGTNAFSQLLLAFKALSNGLPLIAMDKLEKAISKDPLMSLPRILKAVVLFRECSTANVSILEELAEPMLMTEYESKLNGAVQSVIEGQVQDARNLSLEMIAKYPNDLLLELLLRMVLPQEDIPNPTIAAEYIHIIISDLDNATDSIIALRQISPASPRPELFEAYQLYMAGEWTGVINKVDTMDSMESNNHYVGYGSNDSTVRHLAMQLKHFALVQKGKYINAGKLFEEFKDTVKLSSFMYGAQTYTELIHREKEPSLGDRGDIDYNAECNVAEDVANAVSWSMSGAVAYASDSDSSQKRNRVEQVADKLNILDPVDMRDIWKSVSQAFYEFGTAVTSAEDVNNAIDKQKMYLAPSVDLPDLGLDLVYPEELLAWSTFMDSTADFKAADYERIERLLKAVEEARPNRAVSLWTRYKMYRQWREIDSTKRQPSIDAAKALVSLWTDGDNEQGSPFIMLEFYSVYPDSSLGRRVEVNSQETSSRLPDWAIWTILGVSGAVLLALVISCIIWLCVRQNNKKDKKKVFDGSIHSADSMRDNVVPGHGEVMYTGQMNEAY